MNLRLLFLAAAGVLALPSCETSAYNAPGFQGMRTKFTFSNRTEAPPAQPWRPLSPSSAPNTP